NLAQYNLIKLLRANNMITVVGDDDQAIYKFRGASVSNILNFKNDFPDSSEIVLTKNYRSTQEILNTAYHFIQNNNPDRLEYQLNNPDEYYKQHGALVEKINKKLIATREDSGAVELITARTEAEEVRKVVTAISELLQKPSITYNDIALLVRANKTAESYTEALEAAHIPYIRIANTGLYKQELVADIIAYGRILFDRADAPSLVRVLISPLCAIKTEELLNLTQLAEKKSATFYELLTAIRTLPKISEKTAQTIEHLISLIREHATAAHTLSATELLIKIIADLNVREYLIRLEQENPQKGRETIEYVRQFIEKAGNFGVLYEDKSLQGFINHIDVEREAGDSGRLEENTQEQGPEAVKVMTIHASKGLEFSYVFIPQLVLGRFPSIGRGDLIELPNELLQTREILPEGDAHMQEERRLLYVGLTRAKDGVFLSAAGSYGGKRLKKPSQFLFETGLLKDKNAVTFTESATAVPEFLIQSALPSETKPSGEKFSYPVPQKFSYSQIAAFNTCPLQYKYQFVLRIPQDKGNYRFSFGRTMHNTLLELFKHVKARAQSEQVSLFGAAASTESANQTISLEEIYDIYKNQWVDEWYEKKEQKEQYYKAGKVILKEFYERHKDAWPNPWYLEKNFTVTFEGITLKGRIDRIDKIGDNNDVPLVEIVDYKTGKYKEKLLKDDKIQLLIYQIALEDQGLKPVNLRYYYLHEDKQGSASFLGKPEEIAKIKNEIVETVEKIKRSDFPASPSVFNCTNCDFKNICPFSAV
ncbi:MAG: ATP-dependent helicase, partial [Candidatus Jacksonbacteria bacterium]|nr:ATP-dependent helicase [Candidatus Jacksonbacteria bacterium]